MLSRQAALIAFLTVGAYAVVSFLVLVWFLSPTFSDLEETEAGKNVERCRQALFREAKHLDGLVADWSAWDDLYAFVDSRDPVFVRSNIADSTFIQNDLVLICITDTRGGVVASRGFDPHRECDAEFPELQTTPHSLPPTLLDLPNVGDALRGIWMAESGPLLVASRPIITSKRQGPPKGTLIMARPVDRDLIRTLADQTSVSLQHHVLGRELLDEADQRAVEAIAQTDDIVTCASGPDALLAYGIVQDIEGRPALLLHTSMPRQITARGRQVIQAAFVLILTAGALLGAVLIIWTHRNVVTPLQRIGENVARVRETGGHSGHLNLKTGGEFGVLSRRFDEMVDHLAQAREALAAQSFKEGRAEAASAVLHDMRNQMMPLVSSLSLIRNRFEDWPIANIEQAVAEAVDPEVSEERHRQLDRFLRLWSVRFVGEATRLRDDLGRAERAVGAMEQTLARRDSMSKSSPSPGACSVQEIAFEAFRSIPPEARTDVEFVLTPDLDTVPMVRVPLHTTIQLMTGVLANACEASKEAGNGPACVSVSARRNASDEEKGTVTVVIADTGPGFPDESGPLFQRGYSHKAEAGFGMPLHECANHISGFGGTMSVKNREDGQGAEVCLHLPIAASGLGSTEHRTDG